MEVDDSTTLTLKMSQTIVSWANLSDFTYTLSSGSESGVISISNTTQSIIALDAGLVEVKAVHKVTGITRYFDVTVIVNWGSIKARGAQIEGTDLQFVFTPQTSEYTIWKHVNPLRQSADSLNLYNTTIMMHIILIVCMGHQEHFM